MADTQHSRTATRRAILAAAIAVPTLAAVPAIGAALPHTDRTAWDRAFAKVQKAAREDGAYDTVYMRTYDAFVADCPDIETLPCKHYDAFVVADLDAFEAKWLAQRGITWHGDHFEKIGRREIAEVREYRRLRDAAAKRHNFDAIEAEWERLGDVLYEATWELFELPAPDLAAFLWKSEHLFGKRGDGDLSCSAWSSEIMATYMADARRLLSQEGR